MEKRLSKKWASEQQTLVTSLSEQVQANLQALRTHRPTLAQPAKPNPLLPAGILLAGAGIAWLMFNKRRRILLELGLLASSHLFNRQQS